MVAKKGLDRPAVSGSIGRLPGRGPIRERHGGLDALTRAFGCFGELECDHACESSAPVEKAPSVHVDGRSQLFGAWRNHIDVVRLPEQHVDRIEGQVVAEAWGRVDRHETALAAAIEDISRRQIAVEKGCRRDVVGKPGREFPSAFIQFRRNHLDKLRVTRIRTRARVEEVCDAVRERRV